MKSYTLDSFSHVPSVKEQVLDEIRMDDIPPIEEVKALATWNAQLLDLFDDPKPSDRSSALSRIAYFGAELSWSDEQIYSALINADDRWGKFVGRRDRTQRIVDYINRARQKHGYNPVTELTFAGLAKKSTPSDAPVEEQVQIVWDYTEFLDASFPINWLLEELFTEMGIGLLTGYPGVGKTQFALGMAHHLAAGYSEFLNWKNADGPKKVMFLSMEMGAAPFHLFLSTMAPAFKVDRDILKRNLKLVPIGQPIPLDTKEGQLFLNNLLDEHMPDVIFFDSLQTISSQPLTDEQAVKTLMHYLAVTRSKYKCAMAVIHHNRKKANEAAKKEVELSDVYGSTYLTANVDFVLSLKRVDSITISVDELKNRLGKSRESFDIVRDEHLTFSSEVDSLHDRFGDKNVLGV